MALVLALVTCSQTQPQQSFELAAADSIIFVCAEPEMAEQVRGVLTAGLDDALHDHVKQMFSVWMKDETGQPERAARGVRQAVSAYIRARDKLATWQPVPCMRDAP
jgi:hypothetical protein